MIKYVYFKKLELKKKLISWPSLSLTVGQDFPLQ